MTRLGDVATYINGFAFAPDDWSENGLPIIRIQDLTGNSYQMNRYAGEYNPKYEVNRGDVLISWSASLGVYVWQGEKALLNQHIFKVIFDKCDVDKSFYVHQVAAILEKAASQAHGATMKHLTKPVFDALPFYLPDLPTQQRIADTLDKVSEGIGLCRKMLGELDLMVKAKFGEMFGDPVSNEREWNVETLNDVCTEIGDGLHGTPEYDDNGEYPFINGNNLINGAIEITPATKKVNAEIYKKHYIDISANALLLSINGTLGKLAFYNGEKVMLGKSACYCNFKPEINRAFVYGVMKTEAFAGFLEKSATASTIKNVGLKAIRGYKLIMPPQALQMQFIEFSNQVDKSKLAVNGVRRPHPPPAGGTFPKGEGKEGDARPCTMGKVRRGGRP